ncbi:MAG TPA: hypothetical protein PKA90_04440 [Ignavibacteria bacterium]|nr:hypothetical protein [Ignavibacteria bacterium]HMR39658.1 hypothetical protein [Ignavibacteria bacterium]
MKDKSRFLSSVIVSFLAGFIYLIAGENLPVNIQSSVKAILSSNAPDMYLTTECFPFYEISKKSAPKISKNNLNFYLHENEFDHDQYSEMNSVDQATFVRPLPDKNIDFTSELNKLINVGKEDFNGTDNIVNSGNNKILSCNEFQIADAERNFKRNDRINKQGIENILAYDAGNGFRINYVTENSSESGNCEVEILNSHFDESITDIQILVSENCNKVKIKNKNKNKDKNTNRNFNVNWNNNVNQNCTTNKISGVNKIRINLPVTKVKANSEEYDEDYEDYDVSVECDSYNDDEDEDCDRRSEDVEYNNNSIDLDPM